MYGNSLLLIITNNSSFPSIIDKIWIVRSHTTISVYWVSIISFTVLVFFSSIKQNWKFVVGFMSLTLYSGRQCPSHVLWLVCVLKHINTPGLQKSKSSSLFFHFFSPFHGHLIVCRFYTSKKPRFLNFILFITVWVKAHTRRPENTWGSRVPSTVGCRWKPSTFTHPPF